MNLEPYKARLAAATPRPWVVDVNELAQTSIWNHNRTSWRGPGPALVVRDDHMSPGNADLIAHAPTDIAELVAEVERLTNALRGIAQYHPDWKGQHVNNAPSRMQLIDRAFSTVNNSDSTPTDLRIPLKMKEKG